MTASRVRAAHLFIWHASDVVAQAVCNQAVTKPAGYQQQPNDNAVPDVTSVVGWPPPVLTTDLKQLWRCKSGISPLAYTTRNITTHHTQSP